MADILVLANETIGGAALLDAIRERHAQGDARFHVVVPLTRPRHGNVIYDEAVRDSAQVRVDLALAFMRDEGIDGRRRGRRRRPAQRRHRRDRRATGSTRSSSRRCPRKSSGWMKRDLIEALEDETGLPVNHVVVDLARDGLPFDVTLVVANQTIAGGELVSRLEAARRRAARAASSSSCRRTDGDGRAVKAARERLGQLLASLKEEGVVAAGMIGDPDPYDATMNARPVLPHLRHRDLDAALEPLALDGRQARRPRA